MAELAFSGNTEAVESAHMLCRAYENPQKIKANQLVSIKLRL
jgi:hypothetical protein